MPEEKATGKYPTKVYSYRIRITEGEDDLRDMLRRARRYYNELITIELERRQRFRELRAKYGVGDIEALEKREAELVEAKKKDEDAVKKEVSHANYVIHKRVKSGEYTAKEAADARKALKEHTKKLYAWIPKDELKAVRAELKEARRLSRELLAPANEEFKRRIKALAPSNHAMAGAKRSVLDEMASECAWPDFWVHSKAADLDSEARARDARVVDGVGLGEGTWGIYTATKDAVAQAKRTAQGDPFRKRFDGSGMVGCPQLSGGGLTVGELLSGQDPRVGLTLLEPSGGTGRKFKAYRRATGHLKIETVTDASGEKHNKQIKFIVKMHRPLPDDARVVMARIKSEREGNTVRHYLQLSVQSGLFERGVKGVGKVAVNFGWRVCKDGLRVATTLDEHGHVRVFHLPDSIRQKLDYAESVRGTADKHFVAVRDYLLKNRKNYECPDWLLEELHGKSSKWNNKRKLAYLVNRWHGEMLGGRVPLMWSAWKEDWIQQDLFQDLPTTEAWVREKFPKLNATQRFVWWLLTWQRKNSHLFSIERGVHSRALRHRKDYYRRVAAQLAEEYEIVVLDKTKLSDISRRRGKDEPKESEQEIKANANRFVAGVYELKMALKQRFGKDVIEKPAKNISRDHHGCGGEFSGDARASEVFVQCPECEQIVDQDVNAARNILHAREGSGGDGSAVTAREEGSAENSDEKGCESHKHAAE